MELGLVGADGAQRGGGVYSAVHRPRRRPALQDEMDAILAGIEIEWS